METFARYGYRRASMDQVADTADLTRQALYHHFESKEALFRAVVEALHEGALQAAAAGGALAEQAGSSLADVLAGQVGAKIRYVIERLQGSPHVEELLSEHQHQAGDLNQRSHEQMLALEVATIERFAKTRRLAQRLALLPTLPGEDSEGQCEERTMSVTATTADVKDKRKDGAPVRFAKSRIRSRKAWVLPQCRIENFDRVL